MLCVRAVPLDYLPLIITADDTVAEDFITDLVNEFHSVASLACYFLNGYTQGFDEMSEVVSNG